LKQNTHIFYYIILSIIAAALVLLLACFTAPAASTSFSDKIIVGAAFIASCVFGISLAVYPRWFQRFTKRETHRAQKQQTGKTTIQYQGHHPDCEKFTTHTIKIKGKIMCAGCLGLSIGSFLSIAVVILYIGSIHEQLAPVLHLLLILGLLIIFLAYIEITLPRRHAVVHVIANVFLVVGFLLITISVVEITGTIIYGLLMALLSFLWLDTRIQLSNWRHGLICKNCNELCKMY